MAKARPSEDLVFNKIESYLKRHGLKMSKEISSGGLFAAATYDRRTVYSVKDLDDLNKQGFSVHEDIGIWVFNALIMS